MGNLEQTAQTTEIGSRQLTPFGQLPHSFMQDREPFWVLRDGRPVWLGCGDEGFPTPVSVDGFATYAPDAMPLDQGYLSAFGQLPGVAKNIAVTKEITDPGFLQRMGGMPGLLDFVMRMSQVTAGPWRVLPATHSARPQEMAAHKAHYEAASQIGAHAGIVLPALAEVNFLSAGNSDTGCAANKNAGRASSAFGLRSKKDQLADGSTLYDIAGNELIRTFGDDTPVEPVLDSHIAVGTQIRSVDGREYIFNRAMTRDLRQRFGLPTMVLQRDGGPHDEHLMAQNTGIILNLDPRAVRNAHGAAAAKLGYYAVDLGGQALWANMIMREHGGVDPRIFMQVAAAETVPIRGVLASGDTSGDITPDPRRVRLGVRPGIEVGEAIELVEKLSRERYPRV